MQKGMTPLHLAVKEGKMAAIQALLTAKADVHAKSNVRGERGCWEGEEGAVRGLKLSVLIGPLQSEFSTNKAKIPHRKP